MSALRSIGIASIPVGIVCITLAATTPAEAYEYREGNILGYHAEVLDSGSYSEPDLLYVYGPGGKEEIFVTCAPYNWASTGGNTQSFVEQVTQEWCF